MTSQPSGSQNYHKIGVGSQNPHDRPVRKRYIVDTWNHPMSCVCKACTCHLHQCPAYPKFPPEEPIRTVIPFDKGKMDEISTMKAHFTKKPIHPPPRPPSPPQRWPPDKITTYHDHYPEKPLPPPPKPWPPFPERTPFMADTTYHYFHKKPPACPMNQRSVEVGRDGHLYVVDDPPGRWQETQVSSKDKFLYKPQETKPPGYSLSCTEGKTIAPVSIQKSDYNLKPVHPIRMTSPPPTHVEKSITFK
ncbi:hypothetical protein MPTK1_5g04680 [Marchantia polymorpha subsp. ruderalis]|uniref:Uncharacterized protein n=2 Tax=Marchantia polymorpha TaxID=3197 RepID=A0A176W719_MARPO|nr:hypothetical protein AXG93_115s1000 [Marchantia polymorpha subsp. ruderalis]PTQ43060.1 hypothetical protein MARPO_0027s0159 [Marchantia polymorpha]BBN10575.1 hypothetical protein Mp_5g04680 [Marchantia polymorpha subsp. ruderalis]|eukprot:PTQ43060.1 hypothetical protein MARPO_0027s0159 [Marchantia polymorpha]